MEPTLKDGDIVVFRKSESFLWRGNDDEGPEKQFEREQVQEWERTHCNQTISPSWFVKKPPLPVTGNIIVYQDPEYYPSRWNIKRVIGLGGQVVRCIFFHFFHSLSSDSCISLRFSEFIALLLLLLLLLLFSLWYRRVDSSLRKHPFGWMTKTQA